MQQINCYFVIVVLLFGSKKISELAKGVGQGIKVFKKEIENDEEKLKSKKQKQKIQMREK